MWLLLRLSLAFYLSPASTLHLSLPPPSFLFLPCLFSHTAPLRLVALAAVSVATAQDLATSALSWRSVEVLSALQLCRQLDPLLFVWRGQPVAQVCPFRCQAADFLAPFED